MLCIQFLFKFNSFPEEDWFVLVYGGLLVGVMEWVKEVCAFWWDGQVSVMNYLFAVASVEF